MSFVKSAILRYIHLSVEWLIILFFHGDAIFKMVLAMRSKGECYFKITI